MNLRERAYSLAVWSSSFITNDPSKTNAGLKQELKLLTDRYEAALLSVRNETIEECAKVAEKHPVPRATWGITTRGEITKKIRSLRGEEKEKDGK